MVATFELFPCDDIYPLFMTFPVEGSFNERFERLDYASYYTVMNMGSLGIVLVFLLLSYLTYGVLNFMSCFCARNAANIMRRSLFWNSAILFLKGAYLEIVLSVLLQCLVMRESWNLDYFWSIFSNCLCLFLLASSLGLLVLICGYLWPNYRMLEGNEANNEYEQNYFKERFS